MPSTKTLNQSSTISAVENADLLWIWDSSASELNKISRTNLLTTTDDFNTSYARLAGRSGGQTLIGGTAANDDLTLEGTSNATRTTSYVILQPTAGNVGIGTVSPVVKLDVNGSVAADRYILNSAPTNSFQGSLSAIGSDLTYNILAGPTNGPIIRARWSAGTADRYLEFGQADNAGNYTPHFRILNGNVGIGTTSPSTRLDIDAGAIEFAEMTAPAAGAANTGRLFCQDNGLGRTQLCIVFSSGAVQVIATQP